jgi:hypothetical protein
MTKVSVEMSNFNTHEAKHILAQILTTMCEKDNESVAEFMLHHILSMRKVNTVVISESEIEG